MRLIWRLVKGLAIFLVAAVVALLGWLYFAPPELIRVGAGYSAKIVCSNVFLAGRDAGQVLADDVQAPGHPLLKIMRVSVDRDRKMVSAGLLGFLGERVAVARDGLGCTVLPEGVSADSLEQAPPAPTARAAPGSGLWPEGDAIQSSQDAGLAAILDDPAMAGPGMRAMVVVKDGHIVAERYGAGFSAETPLIGWSMTKTVNAAIIGTLVKDGRMAVDDKRLFGDWRTDGRAGISVADLMAMSSGLEFNEDYGDVTDVTRMLFLEPDMAGFAAAKPLAHPVGSAFSYSSGTAMLLSRVWQHALGDGETALVWAACKTVRPARHGQRRAGDRRGRHFRRLLLSLRHGARLGALRPVPVAGRRVERRGDFARRVRLMDAAAGAGLVRRLRARATLVARAERHARGRRCAWHSQRRVVDQRP